MACGERDHEALVGSAGSRASDSCCGPGPPRGAKTSLTAYATSTQTRPSTGSADHQLIVPGPAGLRRTLTERKGRRDGREERQGGNRDGLDRREKTRYGLLGMKEGYQAVAGEQDGGGAPGAALAVVEGVLGRGVVAVGSVDLGDDPRGAEQRAAVRARREGVLDVPLQV
ncbi:hypothetical protein FIBSPDRAFT_882837 [Athelia psychrophila]|uniref:Uncharacterized protein n=1 Tax=Athelia psychrophila TaxID=1759441 RepID=A0A166URY3_9AGAM|nr:hypothetical protein FIBSPDRAFT_882837 [Fibularhizoctonia sp. CBS 109695]